LLYAFLAAISIMHVILLLFVTYWQGADTQHALRWETLISDAWDFFLPLYVLPQFIIYNE